MFFGLGLYWYFQFADDFRLRWLECSYFNLSVNPIAVARVRLQAQLSLGPLPAYAGYPPWSYVLGQFLVFPWLPYSVAKAFFLIFQIFSLWVLVAYSRLFSFGALSKRYAPIVAFAGVASLHLSIVLRHGNYGLLARALLALACFYVNDRKYLSAGLCVGLSFVKPQMSILFLLPLLFKGKRRSVLIGLVVLLVAWAIASIHLGESPWQWLGQLLATSTGPSVEWFTLGLFDFAKNLGFETRQLVFASFVIVFVASSLICFKCRSLPLTIVWSVPAVALTLAGPYRIHDLVVLVFFGLASSFCVHSD